MPAFDLNRCLEALLDKSNSTVPQGEAHLDAYSAQVLHTATTNVAILCVLAALFLGLQRLPWTAVCFDIRRRSWRVDVGRGPLPDCHPPPPAEVRTWPFHCFNFPLGRSKLLMRVVGLDGVVAVRFAALCIHFCALYFPMACALAVVYFLGPAGNKALKQFQISNQTDWVPPAAVVAGAWYLSLLLLYLLSIEFENFYWLRREYMTGDHLCGGEEDSELKRKHDYCHRTVMVEQVPPEIDTHEKLLGAFEKLFPGSVEMALLHTDARDVGRAMRQLEATETQAEIRRWLETGGSRLQAAYDFGPGDVLKASFPRGGGSNFGSCNGRGREEELGLERRHLEGLKAEVAELCEEHVESVGLGERSGSSFTPKRAKSGERTAQIAGSILVRVVSNVGKRSWAQKIAKAEQHYFKEEFAGPLRSLLRIVPWALRLASYLCVRQPKNSTGFVTFRCHLDVAMATQLTLESFQAGRAHQSMVAFHAPAPGDIIWENLAIPVEQNMVRSCVTVVVVTALLALAVGMAVFIQLGANYGAIERLFGVCIPGSEPLLRYVREPEWSRDMPRAYFSTLALTLLMTMVPPIIRTWLRLYEGHKQESLIVRRSILLCFVFNIVTMYTTGFSVSLISVLQTEFEHKGKSTFNTEAVGLVAGFVDDIAANLDRAAAYFMGYILSKVGVRMFLYLLRPYKVLPFSLYKLLGRVAQGCCPSCRRRCCCFGKGAEKPKEVGSQPLLAQRGADELHNKFAWGLLQESPCYDWILPDLVIVLALTMAYGVVAPPIVLFAAMFFWVYVVIIRYNFVFVYTQEYDSGGKYFFILADITIFSLVASLVMVQGYLFTTSAQYPQHTFSRLLLNFARLLSIPALIFLVLWTYVTLRIRYAERCKMLSLEAIRKADCDEQPAWESDFPLYMTPLVVRAMDTVNLRRKHSWREGMGSPLPRRTTPTTRVEESYWLGLGLGLDREAEPRSGSFCGLW